MNSKPNIIKISLIRLALVLIFIFGIYICCWLHPFAAYLSSWFPLLDAEYPKITADMKVQYYTKVIFHWICSLPCFAIVIMDFIETFFARKYGKFNLKSAKILQKISLMLFISSVIYILGNIVFMAFKWNLLMLDFNGPIISFGAAYCIIGAIGVIISVGYYAYYKKIIRGITENKAA